MTSSTAALTPAVRCPCSVTTRTAGRAGPPMTHTTGGMLWGRWSSGIGPMPGARGSSMVRPCSDRLLQCRSRSPSGVRPPRGRSRPEPTSRSATPQRIRRNVRACGPFVARTRRPSSGIEAGRCPGRSDPRPRPSRTAGLIPGPPIDDQLSGDLGEDPVHPLLIGGRPSSRLGHPVTSSRSRRLGRNPSRGERSRAGLGCGGRYASASPNTPS